MKLELRRLRLRFVDGFLLEAIFLSLSLSFSLIRSQPLSLTAFQQLVITVNQQSYPVLMVH